MLSDSQAANSNILEWFLIFGSHSHISSLDYTQLEKKVYTFRFVEYSEGSGPEMNLVSAQYFPYMRLVKIMPHMVGKFQEMCPGEARSELLNRLELFNKVGLLLCRTSISISPNQFWISRDHFF